MRQPAAAVIEFDCDLINRHGVTGRRLGADSRHLVCTNNFRERSDPRASPAYQQLDGVLNRIAETKGKGHVTIDRVPNMFAEIPSVDLIEQAGRTKRLPLRAWPWRSGFRSHTKVPVVPALRAADAQRL